MGNLKCRFKDKDEDAWKQQNMEMEENPAYSFANLAKGGSLIDAYEKEGPQKVSDIAVQEMKKFFYHPDGRKHAMTRKEFICWHKKREKRNKEDEDKSPDQLEAEYKEDYFNRYYPHDACWDLNKRGGVGETPFHLLYLMDSPVHFECAEILLKHYPNLALDVYEGEEYFGESALHIAIVIGDFESVVNLVKAGADINQRATGRFFLPEDQKQGYTGQTDYYGYAYYGEYPLAFAACLGNTDMYDFLLQHGADPNLKDSFGNTVLHMVVIANQADMYKYAVRHHRKKAVTTKKNNMNLTPLTLACKLGRHAIFKEMLDLDSIEFWRFSTTMCSAHPLRTLDSIGPDGNTNWNSALMIIVNGEKDDHLEMLEGGVMRQLIDEKWKTFARKRFIMRLIIAVIHLSLFSVAIYTRPDGSDLLSYRGPVDAIRYTSEICVCLSCVMTVFHELKEIGTQGISSFFKNCTHAPAQTVYLVSCILLIACVPFRFLGLNYVEDVLLILVAPCAWFFLLFFARGFNEIGPNIVMMYLMVSQDMLRFSLIYVVFINSFALTELTGPFVTMIYKMCTGDLYRFALIYCIFLVGFTQGFFFLFRDVDANNAETAKFSTLPETILTLFQMTLGEFKYESFNLSHYAPLTKMIFALFMILVPILLLNMLIAMMGNTYTQVISKSEKEWRKQWAKIVVVLERGMSQAKLLAYQQEYSVKLSGGPPPEDTDEPQGEERALVVIKQSAKSRAKTRKMAVYHWKLLGKEVIRQKRMKKNDKSPFHLEESLTSRSSARKGEEKGMALLTSTVSQLAWEKDIDLTKGQPFVADPDAISPRSPSLSTPKFSFQTTNVSPGTNDLKPPVSIPVPTVMLEATQQSAEAESAVRKRKSLVYNRVSPLISTLAPTELSDVSDDLSARQSNEPNRDRQDYPSPIPEELEMTQPYDSSNLSRERIDGSPTRKVVIADDSGRRIVQSEFSFSADSSSATEIKDSKSHKSKGRRKSKRSESAKRPEDSSSGNQTHKSSDSDNQSRARSAADIEIGNVQSFTPEASTSCWLEDTPPVEFSSKRAHKKTKKRKPRSRDQSEDQASVSSSQGLLQSSPERKGV